MPWTRTDLWKLADEAGFSRLDRRYLASAQVKLADDDPLSDNERSAAARAFLRRHLGVPDLLAPATGGRRPISTMTDSELAGLVRELYPEVRFFEQARASVLEDEALSEATRERRLDILDAYDVQTRSRLGAKVRAYADRRPEVVVGLPVVHLINADDDRAMRTPTAPGASDRLVSLLDTYRRDSATLLRIWSDAEQHISTAPHFTAADVAQAWIANLRLDAINGLAADVEIALQQAWHDAPAATASIEPPQPAPPSARTPTRRTVG